MGMIVCHINSKPSGGWAKKKIMNSGSGNDFVRSIQKTEVSGKELFASTNPLDLSRLFRDIRGKSSTKIISKEKIRDLLKDVLYEHPPLFSHLGGLFWFHNCLTWINATVHSTVSVSFNRLSRGSVLNSPIYFVEKTAPLKALIPLEQDPTTVPTVTTTQQQQEAPSDPLNETEETPVSGGFPLQDDVDSDDEDIRAFMNLPIGREPTLNEIDNEGAVRTLFTSGLSYAFQTKGQYCNNLFNC